MTVGEHSASVDLAVPADALWRSVCRLDGVNYELRPWLRMTAPAGLWRQGDPEPEQPLRLPVPAYLIETETERILVDTGLHPDAVAEARKKLGL